MIHKQLILSALVSGFIYSLVLLGFEAAEGKEFSLWSFLFRAGFFGIIMAAINYYFGKKQELVINGWSFNQPMA